MWAGVLVVSYVAAVTVIGFTAIRYEMVLDGMIETLPPLTRWTFHAHKYTPLFLVLSIPAILCAISKTLTVTQRRVAMSISVLGLVLLAAWFRLIWLGMGYPVKLLSDL
jgi:hypothetical protein